MEYTQEQLDKLVADKIAEATKGMYTEDDLQRKVTAEVDRRVESGIQKGLETQKKKWQDEFEKSATMTAEEIAKKKLEEQVNELTAREREIKKKSNLIEAKDMLSGADIPKSHYEKMLDVLVNDNEDVTKQNITNFIDVFNTTKTEIETKVKSEFSKVTPPSGSEPGTVVTKDIFTKMSYGDKLKFKAESPEQYKEFMK